MSERIPGGRPGRGGLGRLRPAGASAARTPFVLLIVVLLSSGLIVLLLLNAAVNQGSFELSRLQKETDRLTDEEQALQQEVDKASEPGALADRARELGMVPGGNPAFLGPDGKVLGVPGKATAPPSPSPSTASPPSPSPAAGGSPSAVRSIGPSASPAAAPAGAAQASPSAAASATAPATAFTTASASSQASTAQASPALPAATPSVQATSAPGR